MKSEMLQLHDRKVMMATIPGELSPEQKREALACLMFLKRKRSGKIKGRGWQIAMRVHCQRGCHHSPMVATEVVFLTLVIDAMENHQITVFNVPGAFMQADMDELVHVRFTGKMVELLLEINKEM